MEALKARKQMGTIHSHEKLVVANSYLHISYHATQFFPPSFNFPDVHCIHPGNIETQDTHPISYTFLIKLTGNIIIYVDNLNYLATNERKYCN